MADELCGQPRRSDGQPCQAKAADCRWHGAKAQQAPASKLVEAGQRQPGSRRDDDQRAAAAQVLATGASAEEAGRQTGIPASTIRKWRMDPEFIALVRRMNDELVTAALYGLGAIAAKAVSVLDAGLDGNAKPIQVRAADVTLNRLVQVRDHVALADRLAELEAMAAERDETW